MKWMRPLVIAVCAATARESGMCLEPTATPAGEVPGHQQAVSSARADMLGQLNDSLQRLARKVSPAVVQIEVTSFGSGGGGDRADAPVIVRQYEIGAGVIVDPDGYIMTNAHVVEGAHRVRVTLSLPATASTAGFSSGRPRILDARVIGSEKLADLALLKVEASDLPTLPLGQHRVPQPGELVLAVGSPSGLRNSVTMGVVGSAWRQPDPDNPMVYLQTDAPIGPGSSGGPLVDVTGTVVGLNTFILSRGGGSEGLGFAVPAPVVDFVYKSLRKYGRVDHVEIGVVAQTISPAMAQGLGLPQDWGVVVADVTPHGPADAVGMLPGDIIASVDGDPTPSLTRYTVALYQHPSDQALEITVLRGTQTLSFTVPAVRVRERTDQFLDAADPMKTHIQRLGILGLDFNDRLRSAMPEVRIGTGCIVLGHAPGFDSLDVGLRVGDVIHSLNRTQIESVEQLKSAVAHLERGDSVVLRIERMGQFQFLAFEME